MRQEGSHAPIRMSRDVPYPYACSMFTLTRFNEPQQSQLCVLSRTDGTDGIYSTLRLCLFKSKNWCYTWKRLRTDIFAWNGTVHTCALCTGRSSRKHPPRWLKPPQERARGGGGGKIYLKDIKSDRETNT